MRPMSSTVVGTEQTLLTVDADEEAMVQGTPASVFETNAVCFSLALSAQPLFKTNKVLK